MSGLAAARRLQEFGISFLMVEAQNRIGGRIQTEYTQKGDIIEHGAQALNGDMKYLLSAINRAGLNLLPLPAIGRHLCDGANISSARAAIAKLERTFEKAKSRWSKFSKLRSDPGKSVADAVDLMSITAETRKIIGSNIEELWGQPIDKLQFDHAADVAERYDSYNSDWELEIAEGFGALLTALAEPIAHQIILETPVTAIQTINDRVIVETTRGSVTAKAVIVAVPPTVAKGIVPPDHWSHEALESYKAGDLIKFMMSYNHPFWRDFGLSGTSTSVDLSGFATADTTKKGSEQANLTAFVGGPNARKLASLSEEHRWETIKPVLVRLFGNEAANPISVTERIWVDDPWVGGAYNAHVTAGSMLKPDAILRRFEDQVTFACAEIATRFPGYVEGAMDEGAKAAKRVLETLNGQYVRD
ncbi:flavin monoamine oxidase family protein [Parasphingorhabdus litoris]|uniref:Flavin monoamine oxidase family protein n=2 Tax=Parasphingorhabdus litoris TaxID=394733 RepID=A0ABN1A8Q5_9SPHN|nr:NAD(P)/FAD-dependent oxidoreductase [Parasphingorhabdus litoris]